MLIKPLDIRDISVIDSLPVYKSKKEVLIVGCGSGRVECHLRNMGYTVYSTDIIKHKSFPTDMVFYKSDIFNIDSFPVDNCESVICCEVLEHLKDYKKAIKNLLKLAITRVIITVPFNRSFLDKGHINFWREENINEFKNLCKPYSTSISKIRTKPSDVNKKQWCYLIIINKRQKYE